jgi:hypothetical protein
MADFVDCNSNGFGFLTILAALFAEEQSHALTRTGQYAFRVMSVTADRDSRPISCSTLDDFVELFHRSIGLASDNKPALRIVLTNKQSGSGLEDVPECGNYEDLNFFARNTFIYTDDDEVAVNLANIT